MEMLQYEFMQRAFLAGGIVALIASAAGVYLLLRRQALMADMMAHVSLAGVAAGAVLGINPTWSGFAAAVFGAMIVEVVRRSYKSYSEVSIAIIMIGGLSAAVVLMSMQQGISKSFTAYLFGSVVAVNSSELFLIGAAALVGGAFLFILRRPLYEMTFHEDAAKANGYPVGLLSMLFSIVTGMIVAAAMPIVGVLLVSSLMVLPAALAIRIASGFASAVVLAMVIAVSGVFAGLTASYELSTPPGGTIALVLLVILLSGIGLRKLVVRAQRAISRKKAGAALERRAPSSLIDTTTAGGMEK